MNDDPEKIANVALHQRADLMAKVQRLTEALIDIRELVDGEADVNEGRMNLAMKIYAITTTVLGEDR